jgi:cystathionine beta-lyase
MVERAGRDLIEVPSLHPGDGSYQLDLDGIESAFRAGAGSIVLCNPWNPTGICLDQADLAPLLELAGRFGARVIADEIHGAITYPGVTHVPASSLDPETVITVTSASKAWNLPGLKCAQVVLTNEEDRIAWSAYFTPDKVGVGTFGLIANAAAYAGCAGWLEEVKGRLASNRALLRDMAAQKLPGVGFRPPDGTYLAWLDFSSRGIERPAEFFLAGASVALTEGEPFGSGGSGHARLNFATSPEILVEVVERMSAALP